MGERKKKVLSSEATGERRYVISKIRRAIGMKIEVRDSNM